MRDDLFHKGRSTSDLKVHVVLTTKRQKGVLTKEIIIRLEGVFRDLLKTEYKLIECTGGANHIHLLFQYPPETSLSKLVGSLKSVSSRKIRQEFALYLDEQLMGTALWSSDYFAVSCGGLSIDLLNDYISDLNSSEQ
jgi:putative transposase